MALSTDLISQFVKITNDKKQTKQETTVYGITVDNNGEIFVRIDGSDMLTPVISTTNIKAGERVMVLIKDHTATITGNVSSPSARLKDIEDTTEQINNIETNLQNGFDGVRQSLLDLVNEDAKLKQRLGSAEEDIDKLKQSTSDINDSISKLNTDKLDVTVASEIYATQEELNGLGEKVNREQCVLWEGESVMTGSDVITLSEAVSEQTNGIVLVFTNEIQSDLDESMYCSFFIPKILITSVNRYASSFTMSDFGFNHLGQKYLYINDTSINGHECNVLSGDNAGGINYSNNTYVLCRVYGV